VEKPIAATVDESLKLIAMAKAMRRVLMVGHIERFNPAVIELKRRLTAGDLGRNIRDPRAPSRTVPQTDPGCRRYTRSRDA